MTTEKEARLKQLYPEDILSISKMLTDGELTLLEELNHLLESKYRKDINQHWVNATVPEDYFKDIGDLN